MALLRGVLELVAPTRCAGCDLPGTLLCDTCVERLQLIEEPGACPRCGAPFGWLVCTECWERPWTFEAARCAGPLEPPLSRVVTLYKDGGERRLGILMATLMAETVGEWGGWTDVIAYVPATDSARRRRGFDHMEHMASEVARLVGVPCARVLERRTARDQRQLDRAGRMQSAAHTFVCPGSVHGRVLVIDDVFTTGATLDAAADALIDAGAVGVRAAAVARVW